MSLEKAILLPIKQGEAQKIEFMFNPAELKFSRDVSIEQASGSRTDSGQPKSSFKHPNPYSLSISNIILDTYEKPPKDRSVLKPLKLFTDAVEYATGGEGNSERPPIYLFAWGSNPYLKCFVKSCNFRLTMFLPDGTPVRAIVDLSLEQIDDTSTQSSQQTPEVTQLMRQNGGRPILL